MKKKGFTLVEMIVVLGLIGIILPLIYGIYTNGIKQSNYISDSVDVQVSGSQAINQINKDLRLAKFTSNADEYRDEVVKNFDDVVKYLSDNGYQPIYYVESLSSNKPFLYATKLVAGDVVNVYKLLLNESITKKEIIMYSVNSFNQVEEGSIQTDFSMDVDSFEQFALYGPGRFGMNRSKIEINDESEASNKNKHFVVLGCFKYNTENYAYFMHDTTGVKFYGPLKDYRKKVSSYTVDDTNVYELIANVKGFELSHSGITFNVKFEAKSETGERYYPFNVDVNPLNLGGGE